MGKNSGGMIELESPCLHRIHSSKRDVPASYHTLGMTINLETLLDRLKMLHSTNLSNGITTFVTFDEWRDVSAIPEDFFHQHSTLQPVVFLIDEQFEKHPRRMPLHTYMPGWKKMDTHSINSINLALTVPPSKIGEKTNSIVVSEATTSPHEQPDYLSHQDLEVLTQRGWKIASHGPEHSDLRKLPSDRLRTMLEGSLARLDKIGAEPWLASRRTLEQRSRIIGA